MEMNLTLVMGAVPHWGVGTEQGGVGTRMWKLLSLQHAKGSMAKRGSINIQEVLWGEEYRSDMAWTGLLENIGDRGNGSLDAVRTSKKQRREFLHHCEREVKGPVLVPLVQCWQWVKGRANIVTFALILVIMGGERARGEEEQYGGVVADVDVLHCRCFRQ
jgi:hypothetical protein